MHGPPHLRVATYNIHKCAGLDRRTSPERILRVLRELEADILCLQEVIDAPHTPAWDQAGFLARGLEGYTSCFGSNRPLHGGGYGNLTLSRLPVLRSANHDLTHRKREPRGVLQTDLRLDDRTALHVFNIHLGTGFMERRAQAEMLLSDTLLRQPEMTGPRLLLGDFNEWTRGLATRMLAAEFATFQPRHAMRFPRTFPGVAPVLTLDHMYFDSQLVLESSELWRSPTALVASDHLPLVATLRLARAPLHAAD